MSDILDRGARDLYESERQVRELYEQQLRELRDLLLKLAYRLDGERVEFERREDPNALTGWTADQWKSFFDKVKISVKKEDAGSRWGVQTRNGKAVSDLELEVSTLAKELEEARTKLAELEKEAKDKEENEIQAEIEQLPHYVEWPEFPKPPLRYVKNLAHGQKQRRQGMMLYMMATRGWSLRVEMLDVISEHYGITKTAGSLKKMVGDLADNGLIIYEVLDIGSTKHSVVRLSEEGEKLCEAWGFPVTTESEWGRLIRLHNGAQQQAHTAAILVFAYMARRRGYETVVLPEVEDTKAIPDVYVSKNGDGGAYVEVELGSDKLEKWQNLSKLQGFAALCTDSEQARARLVSECKLAKVKGKATDLDTLIGSIKSPLWAERW